MNFRNLFNTCGFAFAVLMSLFLTSCHGMWDEEGQDCTTYKRIRFTYDWNMLYADAFPHEVKTLTLYAFNEDGTLAYRQTANADTVMAKGYMDVSGMPSGRYTFQVWAEGEERHPQSYVFGSPADGASARNGLTAALAESGSLPAGSSAGSATPVDHDITPLYYGASGRYGTDSVADFTDMKYGGVREATVNLMKETENFRIVLADEGGEEVNPSDFSFAITDANGAIDADNNIASGTDTLAYHAWSVAGSMVGEADTLATGTITSLSSVVAEITTNRMVAGHNMRLHVTNVKDGKEIINIPLIDLCLQVKGNYNRRMTDQEYLDRQDSWNLIFFISQGRWISTSIYVQSWRVVYQNWGD